VTFEDHINTGNPHPNLKTSSLGRNQFTKYHQNQFITFEQTNLVDKL